jgi:exonuclease III
MFLFIFFVFILIFILSKIWIKITHLKSHIVQKHELNDIINFKNNIQDKNKKIKIMSFNFFLKCFFDCDNYYNFDCKQERFNYFINNYLENYDIICFQEIYGTFSFFCHKLIKQAEKKGFYWYVVPNSPKFFSNKIMDSGLVTISKYPIVYTKTISFKKSLYYDSLAEKSFQYCIIDTLNNEKNKQYLHIINTHLQSEYKLRDDDALYVKFNQLKQIKHFIDFYHLNSKPLLINGDFNINSYELINNPSNLKIDYNSYSKDYFKILSTLGLSIEHDIIHDIFNKRPPTLFCTYNKKNQKEIDTKHRPEYYINTSTCDLINIPRSVDYMFFIPRNYWLKHSNCKIEKLECKTSDKYLQNCSDHYAITTELIF